MLPTPTSTVKPVLPQLAQQQLLICLMFGIPALLIWRLGMDTPLAHAFFQPGIESPLRKLSQILRNIGTLPAMFMATGGLLILLWPGIWRKYPLLYRTAATVTLTTVLGIGLVNQIIVKDIADRPRPRDYVLTESSARVSDTFQGNSMPSGHAAMGFALAAPFFPLWHSRRRRLAYTFLGVGIAWGTIVGISRMMLGAHFATDVLLAGAITLSSASLISHLILKTPRLSPHAIGGGALLCALAVILGNRFTNLQLVLEVPGPTPHINLPCEVVAVPSEARVPTLTVMLKGYGAPLSTLQLVNKNNEISIRRHLGLYYGLSCTAQLALPPTE